MIARRRAWLPPLVPALMLTGALLTGCAEQARPVSAGSTSDAPAPSSSAESSPTEGAAETSEPEDEGAADAPAFPANAEPDSQDASEDARVTVTDIRVGRHEGFDRVVFEVAGTGSPGWDVRYVDEATSQGKGEVVDVAGDAVLHVTITGAGYPYDTGVEEYASDVPLSATGTQVVTEVVFDATFEGTTVAFVGTREQAPFRVYALHGPERVVVEVADPS